MDLRELTTDEESFFNYCLWEYRPIGPWNGKFKSANLLYQVFDLVQIDGRIHDILRAIRQAFGMSRTVWGVKYLDGAIRWEFYFYDYRRRSRERSITLLLQALQPFVHCQIEANENLPYFMFSIDIDEEFVTGRRALDEIHLYIGTPGGPVSSGISYSLKETGKKLENFYFFYDPRKHLDQMLVKIHSSVFIDPPNIDIQRILWPELVDCNTICIANKQRNDCVYFSGITVDQFHFFLTRMNYPPEITTFVRDNRSKLDHLLYDVGIDYRIDGDDLVILKSGYYGIF